MIWRMTVTMNSDVIIKTRVVDSPVLGERKREKCDELFNKSNSSDSNGDDIFYGITVILSVHKYINQIYKDVKK